MQQLDIVVQLAPPLSWLADKDVRAGVILGRRIEQQLAAWFEELGLPLAPRLKLQSVQTQLGPRFHDFAVVVNGQRVPYSRRLSGRIYESLTGEIPLPTSDQLARTKAWLSQGLANSGQPEPRAVAGALDFVALLTVETIRCRADRLVTSQVASLISERAQQLYPHRAKHLQELDIGFLAEVLRRLLSFPIAVRDLDAISYWLIRGHEAKWSVARIAEWLFDVLRPGVVEIRVHPDTLKTLLKNDPIGNSSGFYAREDFDQSFFDLLLQLRNRLYFSSGLYRLEVRCRGDLTLEPHQFQFRFNDRQTPRRAGLRADQLLINDTGERMKALGIAGERVAHPQHGGESTLINVQHRNGVEAAGMAMITPAEYMVLSMEEEMGQLLHYLFSVEDVEYFLADLSEESLALVKAAETWEVSRLTEILRHTMRHKISIRYLDTILSLLPDFHYTTGTRSPTSGWGRVEPFVYVGDMDFTGPPFFSEADPYIARFDLSPLQLYAEPPQAWLDSGRLHAEFLKCNLRKQISFLHTRGQSTIICYLVDPDIELELMKSLSERRNGDTPTPLAPERTDEILTGIAAELAPSSTGRLPPLLAASTPDVALLLEDLIAEDFPELTVIHRQMVDESSNIQPIARLPGIQKTTW